MQFYFYTTSWHGVTRCLAWRIIGLSRSCCSTYLAWMGCLGDGSPHSWHRIPNPVIWCTETCQSHACLRQQQMATVWTINKQAFWQRLYDTSKHCEQFFFLALNTVATSAVFGTSSKHQYTQHVIHSHCILCQLVQVYLTLRLRCSSSSGCWLKWSIPLIPRSALLLIKNPQLQQVNSTEWLELSPDMSHASTDTLRQGDLHDCMQISKGSFYTYPSKASWNSSSSSSPLLAWME